MIFLMGIGMAPRVFIGYVLAMEFLPQKNTAHATSLGLGIDGLVLMWASLYFMFIDNNWKSLYTIVVAMTFLTVIAACFLPESPRFLVSKGQYDKARKVITKMAKTNKLKKFNTREGEPVPNPDGLLVY